MSRAGFSIVIWMFGRQLAIISISRGKDRYGNDIEYEPNRNADNHVCCAR